MGARELGFLGRRESGFQGTARGFHRNTFGSGGDSRGTRGDSIPASSEFRAGPSGTQAALPSDSISGQVRAISGRDASEVWMKLVPRKDRGRREDRVRAAPAVSCATCTKKRTRAYRFSGNTPAFPAQWFYGLLRALLGERAFLPPSPLRSVCF